jgi:hypothetical protein
MIDCQIDAVDQAENRKLPTCAMPQADDEKGKEGGESHEHAEGAKGHSSALGQGLASSGAPASKT